MEPTQDNQKNESNNMSAQNIEPVYHTISGGPETLHDVQQEKVNESQTSTFNSTPNISPNLNSESIVPVLGNEQQVPQKINITIVVKSFFLSILYYPVVFTFLSSLRNTILQNIISIFVVIFFGYMYYVKLLKKEKENSTQTLEKTLQIRKDNFIVLITYVLFILYVLILLLLVSKNIFGSEFLTLFFVGYGIFASFLLVVSIKNILEKKEYHMLGHFFVFLFSPIFVGFGLCVLALSGASFLSYFK